MASEPVPCAASKRTIVIERVGVVIIDDASLKRVIHLQVQSRGRASGCLGLERVVLTGGAVAVVGDVLGPSIFREEWPGLIGSQTRYERRRVDINVLPGIGQHMPPNIADVAGLRHKFLPELPLHGHVVGHHPWQHDGQGSRLGCNPVGEQKTAIGVRLR